MARAISTKFCAAVKKAERITSLLAAVRPPGDPAADVQACCSGYARLFNAQRYYDAHDVLEHLWLRTRGAEHVCYKGLIQIAGAFVHLQKQHARPLHPKDGRRLRPAVRLFELGLRNIEPFRPRFGGFDLDTLARICADRARRIVESNYTLNPWSPASAPEIAFESGPA